MKTTHIIIHSHLIFISNIYIHVGMSNNKALKTIIKAQLMERDAIYISLAYYC